MEKKIIKNRKKLVKIITALKKKKKKIVLTNGIFDILHPGHAKYLEKAKRLGDVLVVGVNSDQSVVMKKGPKRPINPLKDRMLMLAALSSVDYVTPLSEERPADLIRAVRPNVYVKGGDYKVDQLHSTPIVEELGGKVAIIRFIGNYSTSKIIHKILDI